MNLKFVSLLLLCAASPALAQPASWKDCVEEAAKNNAELRSARESLLSSEFSEKKAYSPFLPQVAGSVGLTHGTGRTGLDAIDALNGGATSDNYTVALTANQNLFAGFQDKAAMDQASANVRLSEANIAATRAKVSYDLKSSYAGLLFAQHAVRLQTEIIKRRQENLKLVSLRFQSGRENKGSVLLSKAYLEQARYNELQARNSIHVAQAQLLRVLGRDEESELEVSEDLPLETPSPNPTLKNLALQTPDYRQAVARAESADAGVSLARSGFFPSLDLKGSVSRTGQDWFPQRHQWSVGATLSLPLFNGGRDFYGAKSAAATSAAASATRDNTARQALTLLRQAHTAFFEATEKLKVDESFREAALKRSEIARSKYNNGLMTFEDWDLIENDLISREATVLQSQKDRAISEAAWQQAQGQGVIQ